MTGKKGIGENSVINMLKEAFPDAGLGDDTAVFHPGAGDCLFASDAVVEGVHFRRGFSTPGQAVQKNITANVSDIYAMGGRPERILLSAGLPAGTSAEDVSGIIEGLRTGCRFYGIELAGGDTVLSPGGYFFDIAIIGSVDAGGAILRKGAREGDSICVTGNCGSSLAGFELLRILSGEIGGGGPLEQLLPQEESVKREMLGLAGRLSLATTIEDIYMMCEREGIPRSAAGTLDMIRHHIVPKAARPGLGGRPAAGRRGESYLDVEGISSMIDISDGLAMDLEKLCRESRVGALIEEQAIPVPPSLASLPGLSGKELTGMVLSSGEEYRRLFTVAGPAAGSLPEGAAVIGKIVKAGEGIRMSVRDGGEESLPAGGYEHLI